VACPALQYFPTISHQRHDFRKKTLLNIRCVLIFYTISVWNISHSKKNSARYNHRSRHKVPIILVRFKWNSNFLDRFFKNNEMWNFMKVRPVGAELFHSGGRTDMTKLIVVFRNFANAPKNRDCNSHNGRKVALKYHVNSHISSLVAWNQSYKNRLLSNSGRTVLFLWTNSLV